MPRFCAHLGYLFTELPLEERFGAARKEGFSGIEHPAPYGFGVTAFRDAARAHDLTVPQIAAPGGKPGNGEKGLACLPGRASDFRDSVRKGMDAAITIGAPMLHTLAGIIPDGETADKCRDTYLTNIAWATEQCAEAGLTLIIEPISNQANPGFFLDNPLFAAELIRELGNAGPGMLFDTYHAAATDIDILTFFESHLNIISHVQVSDFPGRHEPGTGTLPFDDFFKLLDHLNYPGWVGCEYKPATDTSSGLGWAAEFITPA
tara:strand:+ start:14666 stop:15451 length:786 start_codon:yes stop_codon:yes gene_type:complete